VDKKAKTPTGAVAKGKEQTLTPVAATEAFKGDAEDDYCPSANTLRGREMHMSATPACGALVAAA